MIDITKERGSEALAAPAPRCRFCGHALELTFADLGYSPLANSYRQASDLRRAEKFYPLKAYVCTNCYLVQLEEMESPPEIFTEYLYFSSLSKSWLKHAALYAKEAAERFALNDKSLVLEIGSNDGYLLQYFKEQGIGVLGVEPAKNVAAAAREKGLETISEFFSAALAKRLAQEGKKADLVVANNVIAHIPALNDAVKGIKTVLKSGGVVSLEFPHLLRLIEDNQFDTIYHEHYSYFSLSTMEKVLKAQGLRVFDVVALQTHGGSLRVFACHAEASGFNRSRRVEEILAAEAKEGLNEAETYTQFNEKVKWAKREILKFLIELKDKGFQVAGYGAPAKASTLFNYLGVGPDLIDYTVDLSPHKQGLYLPGSRIPICAPEKVFQTKPDYLIILPWNLKTEIMAQMKEIKAWGGQFVTLIPEVKIY